MSHNLLKLNTNSFDVNSNRTESIGSPLYAYVECNGGSPPFTFSTGDDFLFYRGTVANTFTTSQIQLIDHASHANYIRYIRLKEDGTYRLVFRGLTQRSAAPPNVYIRRLEVQVSSVTVSNTSIKRYNEINYRMSEFNHSIVTRSGSDVDISLKMVSGSFNATAAAFYDHSSFFVERLQ